jgi:2-methylisocitrate lyase-like PEP mutase family enzyme
MSTLDQRVRAFHDLHRSGCFVIPNPWDAGSARLLVQLGFAALATTSSGMAWTMGLSDNRVPLADALAHLRTIAGSVDVPVSADFEGGFAVEPEKVAANVQSVAETGIAGLSIEDSTGDAARPLFDFDLAVERIAAARRALDERKCDATGTSLLLTARSEGFLVGRADFAETIRRLNAYAEAGADCVYAPGIRDVSMIARLVAEVSRPVNALAGSFATVQQLADAGVRRISVGGALARTAWGGFLEAAREIKESGTFTSFDRAVPFADLEARFK